MTRRQRREVESGKNKKARQYCSSNKGYTGVLIGLRSDKASRLDCPCDQFNVGRLLGFGKLDRLGFFRQ